MAKAEKTDAATAQAPVIAYKGFSEDWTCYGGFKFAVGETYEHNGKVAACKSGFHACENPLDVWSYFGPCESRFALVELSGEMSRHDGDSKVAAARITVKAELSLTEFIKHAVAWVIERVKPDDNIQAASGYSSKLAASGKNSVIASSAINATAKGADGTWISLAGFDDKGMCIGFATGRIGQGGLKPDVWYRARGGQLVEASQ